MFKTPYFVKYFSLKHQSTLKDCFNPYLSLIHVPNNIGSFQSFNYSQLQWQQFYTLLSYILEPRFGNEAAKIVECWLFEFQRFSISITLPSILSLSDHYIFLFQSKHNYVSLALFCRTFWFSLEGVSLDYQPLSSH